MNYNERQRYSVNVTRKDLGLVSAPYYTLPMNDPYSYVIEHDILLLVSKRIELMTRTSTTTWYGSHGNQIPHYSKGVGKTRSIVSLIRLIMFMKILPYLIISTFNLN